MLPHSKETLASLSIISISSQEVSSDELYQSISNKKSIWKSSQREAKGPPFGVSNCIRDSSQDKQDVDERDDSYDICSTQVMHDSQLTNSGEDELFNGVGQNVSRDFNQILVSIERINSLGSDHSQEADCRLTSKQPDERQNQEFEGKL